MNKICLFAGTSEGRRIAEFLQIQDVALTVCVATDYGGSLLEPSEHLTLSTRRLKADEIGTLLCDGDFDLVIDATHPYATIVTENIRKACDATHTPCKRLVRKSAESDSVGLTVPDIHSAVEVLNASSGNILLTTGSKELGKFTEIQNFSDRVYARVLPLSSSLEASTAVGLKPSHIIAMQGPFSEELNEAMIRSVRAEWLVTKDSSDPGGFAAKAEAAQQCGCKLLVIGRPLQEEGLDEIGMIRFLCDEFGFNACPDVKIIGIGPGAPQQMTQAAVQAINAADCLIGAKRLLPETLRAGQVLYEAVAAAKISGYIHDHPQFRRIAVLMSGDSSFYSGTKRLLPLLADCKTEVLPGISSLSMLCARLGISAEEIHSVSLHGCTHDLIPEVRRFRHLFVLTGGENTVPSICHDLTAAGYGHLNVTVGERLSYPDERITRGKAAEIDKGTFCPLAVMLIENDSPDGKVTHGLPDASFERNIGEKGVIPMTKRAVRSVSLSHLGLTNHSICWDIGSGTGSVAIEMALQAREGFIYAVDHDPAAVELGRKNAETLHAGNIQFIHGSVPEVCHELPTPTHVFIGGSSGNVAEIIRDLVGRKSKITLVVTAVSLETVSELTSLPDTFPEIEMDTVMIQTAESKRAGSHHLMLGGNPVYIFTMKIGGNGQ